MILISKEPQEEDLEDIKEIKKYLSRIFTVLSEEIKEKLANLDISEKKKKSIIKDLAFLPEKKQFKYLDELYRIYQKIVERF